MFLLKIWIMLCFSSMCLLCFRFMFFYIFSVMFLLKIGLCLVFLRFCYDCYVDLFSVVFFSMFPFCFAMIFCFICIMLNSVCFLLCFCWVSVYMFCGSTKFALPFGNPSNLPSQLASELGSLQLVSQVCRGKTSWTNTGQFQFRIRASKILRPPVPWCTSVLSSARLHRQKNCRAPPGPSQRDPVWKPLDSKETVSTKWANLEDRS